MSSPQRARRQLVFGATLLLASMLGGVTAHAQTVEDYTALPLEELLTIEVTSVAKKPQAISEAAAAVSVVTREDIRRSGAQTIPELLRMVPGVEVAQLDTHATALSVRGFNTRFANTLLVMVDGRSVYVSPLSGVLWDQQLVPIESIERIEVVRGPGATLWGSNAVNGVINIVTKHSVDTLGTELSAYLGSTERRAMVRQGGRVGDTVSYRLYATGRQADGLVDENGDPYNDDWRGAQIGFRLDIEPNKNDAFTLQGDAQIGDYRSTLVSPTVTPAGASLLTANDDSGFAGFNLLGRWSRQVSDTLDWTAQAYFDHVSFRDLQSDVTRNQIDTDFGLRWQQSDRQELVVGLAYRVAWDKFLGRGGFISFTNPTETDHWLSGFVQDDLWLVPDRLRLSLGTKLEHNSISGFSAQPSARMFMRLSEKASLWAAASRAVRTPARFETSATIKLGTVPPGVEPNSGSWPLSLSIIGSDSMAAEQLWAYEAGFRADLAGGWTFDIAGYYNDYDKLRSYTPASLTPQPGPSLALQYVTANDGKGRGMGAELSLAGPLADWWQIRFAYSLLDLDIPEQLSRYGVPIELQNPGLSPHNQLSLRSEWTLGQNVEFDAWLRYVDKLPGGPVDDYVDLDLRAGWRFASWGEVTLHGQNLLSRRRLEFTQPFFPTPKNHVERSIALGLHLRF